jgi:hypothetical protein
MCTRDAGRRGGAYAIYPKECMVMRTTFRLAVSLTTVLAASLVAGPASAGSSSCKDTYFCVWEHSNYGGSFMGSRMSLNDYTRYSTVLNDQVSSLWNRTASGVGIYTDANYGGSRMCIPSGYIFENLNVPAYQTFNDSISSHKFNVC